MMTGWTLHLAAFAMLTFCSCANGSQKEKLIALVEEEINGMLAEAELMNIRNLMNNPPTPLQIINSYFHGSGLGSFESSFYSNLVQDHAVFFNARSIKEFESIGIDALTNVVTAGYNTVCPLRDFDCTTLTDTYRPIAGVCNSIRYPYAGSTATAQLRKARPKWESVELISKDLSDEPFPNSCLRLKGIGARFNIGQFRFHIKGDGPVSLYILKDAETCETVKCYKDKDCNVNGVIVHVEPIKAKCDFDVRANSVVLDQKCKKRKKGHKFEICHKPEVARIDLDPKPYTASSLWIDDQNVDQYTPDTGGLFPDNNAEKSGIFTVTVYKDKIIVCKSCDCSTKNIIMKGQLNHGEDELDMCLNRKGSDVVFGHPVRNNLIIESRNGNGKGIQRTIDQNYMFNNRLRFGFRGTSGELNLLDKKDQLLARVSIAGDELTVSTRKNDGANYFDDTKFRYSKLNFKDGRDDEFEDFGAVWTVWKSEHLFVGIGNVVGNGIYDTPLSIYGQVDSYSVSSGPLAEWIFDIEKVNEPAVTSFCGLEKPSARTVSLKSLSSKKNAPPLLSSTHSLFAFQAGQLLDHDTILTPLETDFEHAIPCVKNKVPLENQNRFCYNIPITPETNSYGEQGSFPYPEFQALEFVRSSSILSCEADADLRIRHNPNFITATIDASNVYGSTANDATGLRENGGGGGKLKSNMNELPESSGGGGGEETCNNQFNKDKNGNKLECKRAGDLRANEQPGLTAIHTLFLREHNRLEGLIEKLHPKWNNETLYQTARRIVIAETQGVMFNELLPVFLNKSVIDAYNLGSGQGEYNPNAIPAFTHMCGIAFRFGHTLIPKFIVPGKQVHRSVYQSCSATELSETFFNPQIIDRCQTDGVLENYHKTPASNIDGILEDEVTQNLFININADVANNERIPGTDLGALNVQRGRDHGIPSINTHRKLFGLQKISTFKDAVEFGVYTQETIDTFSMLYDTFDDVDAFPALVNEIPMADKNPGSTSPLGEMTNLVLAECFSRVKMGDRFWYEFPGSGFSNDQVAALNEGTSLARIVCDNTDTKKIQQMAMLLPDDKDNKPQPCSKFPSLDVELLTKTDGSNSARSMNDEKRLEELIDILNELKDIEGEKEMS